MRRRVPCGLLVALVVMAAGAAPAAADRTANPNAMPWTQIDSMSPQIDTAERFAGNTLHLTFRREGTFVAWVAEEPVGAPDHTGEIEWSAAAHLRFDPTTGLPEQWTAISKGTQTFADGVVCAWSNATKVEFDFAVFPPFWWDGNTVAQCDDGSSIHGRNSGPLPPTIPGGSDQITHGVRIWPGG